MLVSFVLLCSVCVCVGILNSKFESCVIVLYVCVCCVFVCVSTMLHIPNLFAVFFVAFFCLWGGVCVCVRL